MRAPVLAPQARTSRPAFVVRPIAGSAVVIRLRKNAFDCVGCENGADEHRDCHAERKQHAQQVGGEARLEKYAEPIQDQDDFDQHGHGHDECVKEQCFAYQASAKEASLAHVDAAYKERRRNGEDTASECPGCLAVDQSH